MINIERANRLDGWMLINELVWLAEQARSCKIIVEVGSWMGRSTRALADNTSGTVYAVDTWKGSIGGQDEKLHKEIQKGHPEDWLKQTFLKNMEGLQNVEAVQMPSVEAAAAFQSLGRRADMIFLDAAHDYENVKADILAWRPLLSEGGLLCGHDYNHNWEGVVKAVNELVPNRQTRNPESSIWYARI